MLRNSSITCLRDKDRMLINTTRILAGYTEDTGSSRCPDHKYCAFFGASSSPSYKKPPLTIPAHLSSPSPNSWEQLLFKPHFRTDLLSLLGVAASCRIMLSSHRAVTTCTFLTWPRIPRVSAHEDATLPRFLMSCARQAGGFPPSARHGLEKTGSRGKCVTFPRTTLTRLSIHGEGHGKEEAKRHRGGGVRQLKLRAAREGPALHLEAWKKQGQRAAFLQGLHPASHLHSSTAPPPCNPSKSHSEDSGATSLPSPNPCAATVTENIHQALKPRTGVVPSTFQEFSLNSHNTPMTQAFPSPLIYRLRKLRLTEANSLPGATQLGGGQTQMRIQEVWLQSPSSPPASELSQTRLSFSASPQYLRWQSVTHTTS